MKHINWLMIVVLMLMSLPLMGCAPKSEAAKKIEPVKLEPIEGTDFKRVILTGKAAERINIQTTVVNGASIPYAAVIYDTEGKTWAYTNPEPLTFVRTPISIERIDGDRALLSQALDSGTIVVILGVSELYGAETGVSK